MWCVSVLEVSSFEAGSGQGVLHLNLEKEILACCWNATSRFLIAAPCFPDVFLSHLDFLTRAGGGQHLLNVEKRDGFVFLELERSFSHCGLAFSNRSFF